MIGVRIGSNCGFGKDFLLWLSLRLLLGLGILPLFGLFFRFLRIWLLLFSLLGFVGFGAAGAIGVLAFRLAVSGVTSSLSRLQDSDFLRRGL